MGNTVDFASVYQMQYILKRRTKAERKEVYHHERRIGSNTSNTGKRRGGKQKRKENIKREENSKTVWTIGLY